MPSTSRGPAGRSSPSGPRSSSAAGGRQRSRAAAPTEAPVASAGPRPGRDAPARPPAAAASASPSVSPSGRTAGTAPARASLTTRAAILLGVVGLLAASYAFPLRAWLTQRTELAAAEVERADLQDQVDELTDAVRLWDDPAYVRAQARERLNFVLPGEVGLVVLGTEATSAEPVVSDGAVVPTVEQGQPWWSGLVASFYEVGNPQPDDPDATVPGDGAPAGPAVPGEPAESGTSADPADTLP